MKLYVLGVGDTFTEKHVTHALLLEAEGFRLAIDCPDSYRRVLRAARDKAGPSHHGSLDLFAIDDVLVTHVHGDHMNGLEGVGYFKHFAQKKPLNLHTIAPVKDALWQHRLVASMGTLWNGKDYQPKSFDDYFAWREVALETTTTIGPFTIRARTTKHHVPTSALFVEHGGRSIAISSDTAFDRDLIDFLAPADVIVHETNYGPAHTAYSDLLTLDESVKAKMRLIHYPDEFDVAGSAIAALTEGQVIEPVIPMTDPDELLEVYDEGGRPTGVAKKRGEIHRDGDWHLAFFCWIVRGGTELVLQRRAPTKDVWPGRFDASAAGHVRFGETTKEAAREIQEELGIEVDLRDLEALPRHHQEHRHANGIIDREIHDLHVLRCDLALDDYRPGPEVTGIASVPIAELVALAEGERETIATTLVTFDDGPRHEPIVLRRDDLVPYDAGYWRRLAAPEGLLRGWIRKGLSGP